MVVNVSNNVLTKEVCGYYTRPGGFTTKDMYGELTKANN